LPRLEPGLTWGWLARSANRSAYRTPRAHETRNVSGVRARMHCPAGQPLAEVVETRRMKMLTDVNSDDYG
jgi:ribosomal protein L34